MVRKHRRRSVAQIFFRQRGEQLQGTPGISFPARFAQEIHDLGVIAARSGDKSGHIVRLHANGASKLRDGGFHRESGDIGVADGVFAVEAAVVLCTLCSCHVRQVGVPGRGNHIDGKRKFIADCVIEDNRHLRLPAERDLPEAEPSVAGGRNEHIAQPRRQRCPSLFVGCFARNGIKLGIIVELELHNRTRHRIPRGIGDSHRKRGAGGIIRDHVDFGIVGRGFHHLFRTVVIAEYLGVHQHSAAGRGVEPPEVQHRFRLAGPEEIPPPVGPGLDPGVVVVGMRPAGRVNLPGRDAHRPQGRDEQGRLLTAAAVGRAHRGQRRAGPRVRRLVVGLLVTPVIHFQNGVVHRQPSNTRFETVVKYPARIVEVLVVHPHGKHEMPKQVVGNGTPPRHLLPGSQRAAHVFKVEAARIVGNISHGHVGIKEHHGFAFLPRHRVAEHPEQVAPGQ